MKFNIQLLIASIFFDMYSRVLEESKNRAEKLAASLQQRLDTTVEKYDATISQYKAEIETLQDDLDFRNKTLKSESIYNRRKDRMRLIYGSMMWVT